MWQNLSNKSLEELSNIAWAKEYPDVWKLFEVLDKYEISTPADKQISMPSAILREDIPHSSLQHTKEIILENAPRIDSENHVVL